MEPSQIINDVSKTLYKIIRSTLDPDVKIVFGSPADEDVSGDNSPKVFLFLFNVIVNPHFRNLPSEIKGGKKPTSERPPIGLNLQYMIIPSSQSVSGAGREAYLFSHTAELLPGRLYQNQTDRIDHTGQGGSLLVLCPGRPRPG